MTEDERENAINKMVMEIQAVDSMMKGIHSEAKAVCRQEKSLKNRAVKNIRDGDLDQGIALLIVAFGISVHFAPMWLSAFATAIAFLAMLFHE